MLKIGCAEEILEAPLFAELCGYSPFAGRRNLGTRDPLYCRAVTLFDGEKRAILVYTDNLYFGDRYCRELRQELAERFHLEPAGIAFIATHTHTAPKLTEPQHGIGFGESTPEFLAAWKKLVPLVVFAALKNEEEISSVEAGSAPLARPLGENRVDPETNQTDPAIRFLRFLRADGSVKVLLHNHGIHGIAIGYDQRKMISADWMGAANKLIKERKLSDMPLFMLGPCGDINTYTNTDKTENAPDVIGSQYIDDLVRAMDKGGTKLKSTKISFALKNVDFPLVQLNEEQMQAESDQWKKLAESKNNPLVRDFFLNFVERYKEMILLYRQGHNFAENHDLQVIRLGEASFFFVPAEFFIESGLELMDKAEARYPFVATVANGAGGYLPPKKLFEKYPTMEGLFKGGPLWGFYEIYGYMHDLSFRYGDDVVEFVNSNLLTLEKEQ